MQPIEHPLDKYILGTKQQLNAIPDSSTEVFDTSLVQVMCLEKFANYQGYRIEQGLFVQDDPACRVMNLDAMVRLYNITMPNLAGHPARHSFIEKVYLAGRNLRKGVRIQQHRIKFL